MTDLHTRSATRLSILLAAREVSSEEVTRAFLRRIDAVNERVRAFTEVLREEAIAAARRADEERRRGDVRGPLHGLPVTIKENIDVAGHASTLGVPARKGKRSADDAAIVQLLRAAGAVILGRTNVSQLLLFHECRNPVFGQTANPWSADHTPGGSSGGEAAALAAGMSPLGIGTDIGGSIRVPAHFTGVAGLKPSLDRWTNLGSNTAIAGQEIVRAQLGPMARSARDVALLVGALDPRQMSALDARVPPLLIEDPARVDVSKLRVGTFASDGLLPPSRAVARAVGRAAEALEARGATVTEFTPPAAEDAIYTYFAALSSDGGATAEAFLAGGELDPSLASLMRVAKMPAALRRGAARVAGLGGEPRLERLLRAIGEKSVADLWRITQRLRDFRVLMLQAMAAARVDVLLCPAHATPALPHGASKDFALAGSPSMLWNIVQFPAGSVAVTRVRADEARRERARDRLEKRAALVDEKSVGLPVGVQIVARPWAEHLVLAAMIAIEDELRGREGRPLDGPDAWMVAPLVD